VKTRIRLACSVLAVLIVGCLGSPAWAEKSLEDLLVEKGVLTQEDLEDLQKEAKEDSESEKNDPVEKAEAADPNDLVTISATYKGLAIKTRDDKFKFAFGGRLQVDAGVFEQDRTNLGDGAEVRRGRIKSFGTLWEDWDYKLEVNFDPDLETPMTDAWLRYTKFDPFTVTVGHQKVPFSQQSMTSSNWQVFQERALINAFIDNEENGRRRLGAVLQSYGDHWNYAGGVFAAGLGTNQDGTNEDVGTGHRFVWQPIVEKTKVLALGGSMIYRNFNGRSELRYRQRPEAHIADVRLVDTGTLRTANDVVQYDLEATAVWGRFHAQAEYTGVKVWRGSNDRNLDFWGWYAQAGVFLTGESRNYDRKSAKYKRPMPEGDWGAWELAARFSQIDLTNAGVEGGIERNVTAGLNWWANRNVMFRLNYVYGNPSPNSGATLGRQNEHVHGFLARAQVVF
jgi:phosphate-selective porin OprO/OprP